MSESRHDARGYLVRQVFGMRRRQVFQVPGEVKTKSWCFKGGAVVMTQSLADAHQWLDRLVHKIQCREDDDAR